LSLLVLKRMLLFIEAAGGAAAQNITAKEYCQVKAKAYPYTLPQKCGACCGTYGRLATDPTLDQR